MIDEDLRLKIEALKRAGLAAGVHGTAYDKADALTGALEAEIRSEQAAAYGRAGRKVEAALVALGLATDALLTASDAEIAAARRAWREVRDEAERARWELLVHREALGLLRQGDVEEQYPIPPRPPR